MKIEFPKSSPASFDDSREKCFIWLKNIFIVHSNNVAGQVRTLIVQHREFCRWWCQSRVLFWIHKRDYTNFVVKFNKKGAFLIVYQSDCGYSFNSDSIFLIHFISKFQPKGEMLDVGCGVGVVGLVLSREFDIKAHIVDKQSSMIDFAEINYSINTLDVEALHQDFFDLKEDRKFDIVVSNPPFYATGTTKSFDENIEISRHASHMPLEDFIAKVHKVLKPKGRFFFCYDAKQIPPLLSLLEKYHLRAEHIRFVHSKKDRDSKLIFLACRHNSKSATKVEPPFIVFGEDNNYLQEAKEAFGYAKIHSIKAKKEHCGY